MPVDSLQDMRHLMNDYICHQRRQQPGIGLGNAVVEYFDVHPLVGESIGQRAGMKSFRSHCPKANHHRVGPPLTVAGFAVPIQLDARRQEQAGGLGRRIRHAGVFAVFDANRQPLTVRPGRRPRTARQYRRHRDHR